MTDRQAAATRYGHVAAMLRRRIREQHYAVGAELPPIAAIAGEFGVSHMTVKQALGLLRDEGLITTGRGVRARVTARPGNAPAPLVRQLEAIQVRLDNLENRTRALELHAAKPTWEGAAEP